MGGKRGVEEVRDTCIGLLLCHLYTCLSVCFLLLCLFSMSVLNSCSCKPKCKPLLRDVFIPAVSLSRWRLTLHPSVLPCIPPSPHPPILVWSFVAQQRGKASDNKQPCVCVCRATDYTGETRCSLFLPHLHFLSLFPLPVCVCECVNFCGHASTSRTCEVLCTL